MTFWKTEGVHRLHHQCLHLNGQKLKIFGNNDTDTHVFVASLLHGIWGVCYDIQVFRVVRWWYGCYIVNFYLERQTLIIQWWKKERKRFLTMFCWQSSIFPESLCEEQSRLRALFIQFSVADSRFSWKGQYQTSAELDDEDHWNLVC